MRIYSCIPDVVSKSANIIMTVDFAFSTSCQQEKSSLESGVRTYLSTINGAWQNNLCGIGGCSSLYIGVECMTSSSGRLTVNFTSVQLVKLVFFFIIVTCMEAMSQELLLIS